MAANSRRLIQDLNVTPSARYNFTSPTIRKSAVYRPKNEWTITWESQSQTEFYGKTIEQQNDIYGVSLTYRTHYIPALNVDHRTQLTPKKLIPALRPCLGNCGHGTSFSNDLRLKCILVSLTTQLITFKVYSKSYIPPIPLTHNSNNLIFPIKSLFTIRALALNITKHRLIVPNVLPTHVPIFIKISFLY